jgi:hypothetical protein
MIEDEPFDLEAIKQRAQVRLLYPRGKIGDPVPWCHYCKVKLPGETQQSHESVLHEPGCPVPDAISHRSPDFDALLAEVERLQGQQGE